jgi:hypothetical protein
MKIKSLVKTKLYMVSTITITTTMVNPTGGEVEAEVEEVVLNKESHNKGNKTRGTTSQLVSIAIRMDTQQ